jgi:hypothetical protein
VDNKPQFFTWDTPSVRPTKGPTRERKLNPRIIREGDRVRIVNPLLFIRCGYPMCLPEETERINKTYRKDILDLLNKVEATRPNSSGNKAYSWRLDETIKKIAQSLAYMRLHSKYFGGAERKIFTVEAPSMAGYEFTVHNIMFVKTGTHFGPSGDAEDYEPGGLWQAKTHKIVGSSCWTTAGNMQEKLRDPIVEQATYKNNPNGVRSFQGVWLEACNVEKVKDGPEQFKSV